MFTLIVFQILSFSDVGSKTAAECQQKYEQQFEKQQRDAVDDEDCDTKELTLKERTDDFLHAAPKQRGRIVEAFLAKKESGNLNFRIQTSFVLRP
jgi:hypothetical protein